MRVLVVEDERPLTQAIADGLRGENAAVDVAFDGGATLKRLAVNDYDVVVFDRDLLVVHGDQICRELAAGVRGQDSHADGRGQYLSDRVEGLDLGADDHLAKPYAFAELAARVRALGRRAGRPDPPVLERAGLIIQVFLPAAGHARPRGTAQRAAPEGAQDFATQHYL